MMRTLIRTGLLLSLLPAMTGCINVQLGLGGGDAELRESVVGGDRSAKDKVLIIDLEGVIGEGSTDSLFGSTNQLDRIARSLEKAADDDAVKALVLRINSPGGSVTASDMIYRELRAFAHDSGKPVVASMGTVAASGGYYSALAADEIIAEPTTVTGSIGVIFSTLNVSKGLNRLGVISKAVVSGPNKNLADPFEPMKEEHYAIMQSIVDEYAHRFHELVFERRPSILPGDRAIATDGRVYSGVRACEIGLVDGLGGVEAAAGRAMARAGIDEAKYVKYHRGTRGPTSVYDATWDDAHIPTAEARSSIDVEVLQRLLENEAPVPAYLWLPGL